MAWDKGEPAGTRAPSLIDNYVIANQTALEAFLFEQHSQAQDVDTDGKHRPGLCTVMLRDTFANIDALADLDGCLAIATDAASQTKGMYYNPGTGWVQVQAHVEHGEASGATDVTRDNVAFEVIDTGNAGEMTITQTFSAGLLVATFIAPMYIASTSTSIVFAEVELRLGGVTKSTVRLGHKQYGVSFLAETHSPVSLMFQEVITAGAKTIDVRWRSTCDAYQQGATVGPRMLLLKLYRGLA